MSSVFNQSTGYHPLPLNTSKRWSNYVFRTDWAFPVSHQKCLICTPDHATRVRVHAPFHTCENTYIHQQILPAVSRPIVPVLSDFDLLRKVLISGQSARMLTFVCIVRYEAASTNHLRTSHCVNLIFSLISWTVVIPFDRTVDALAASPFTRQSDCAELDRSPVIVCHGVSDSLPFIC